MVYTTLSMCIFLCHFPFYLSYLERIKLKNLERSIIMYLENFKELTSAIAEKETDPAEALKMGDYLYDRTSKFVNYFNKVCDHLIKG